MEIEGEIDRWRERAVGKREGEGERNGGVIEKF
jgi:hypothetical protein